MSPTRNADLANARARLRKAQDIAENCELLWNRDTQTADLPDVYVTSAVHAGIAAADVICIRRLGRYVANGNHVEAVKLLQSVDDSAATALVDAARPLT